VTLLLAAGCAAASVAVLVALPSPGRLRFAELTPPARPSPAADRSTAGDLGPGRAGGRRERAAPVLLVVLFVGLLAARAPAAPVLLAAAGLLVVTRGHRARRDGAARAAQRAAAVEACGVLAAELRAGRAPAAALAAAAGVAVGPLAAALRAAAATAGLGGDVAGSLRAPAAAPPDTAHLLPALAACWSVCAASGSGLAAAVERLEEGLRAEQAQRRAVEAELAGPRATAGLLAALPLVGLLLAAGLGADPVHVLLRTPVGLVCLVAGLALEVLGLWWTGRLVRRAGGTV
jgi:tight adherence protein B